MKDLEAFTTREYYEAVELASDLVNRETHVMHFLHRENYNTYRAAKRIALYWKYRKVLFGERWLLPMSQTGTGALSMDDTDYIRSGYCVPVETSSGRIVFLVDMSRLASFSPQPDRNCRFLFYLGTVLAGKSLQSGAVTVHVITASKATPGIQAEAQHWDMIHNGLPLKIAQVLVAQVNEQGRELYLEFMSFQAKKVAEFNSRTNTELLVSDSPKNIYHQLRLKGIPDNSIPSKLGGSYSYALFAQWVRERMSQEGIMSAVPLQRNAQLCSTTNTQLVGRKRRRFATDNHGNDNKDECDDILSLVALTRCNERDLSKSAKNALQVRRCFQRQRMNELSLQDQVEILKRHQRTLRQENNRLEAAWTRARLTVFDFLHLG